MEPAEEFLQAVAGLTCARREGGAVRGSGQELVSSPLQPSPGPVSQPQPAHNTERQGWGCSELRLSGEILQQEQGQYSTVQYSTVQYSTVQYGTVQYSTVQYSTVQYSTVLT